MMSNPPLSYLDASAVLAFLNNEAGRAEDLTALFEEAERGNVRLVTSTITLSEVAYIKASDATSDSEMDARIDDLLVERGIITLIECTEDIARGARRYVRQSAGQAQRLKPLDAIHLSSAAAVGADHFLTYDSDFDAVAADVDFEITKPAPAQPTLDLRDETV